MINDFPRTLIIGTLPYNPNESSRALDTYFNGWPKDKLRMIYSNVNKPSKGHCESFFQITDRELVSKFFKPKTKVGKAYFDAELSETELTEKYTGLEKIAKNKNAFRYYARKTLWKNRWKSGELDNWIKDFNPEQIYICFSDDYFILDIAYQIAKQYNIPIVCQISDDYYFLFKNNRNVLMKSYIKKYLKLFENVMETNGFAIYIADKIAKAYNETFKKQGMPIYLSSDIVSNENKEVVKEFNYFGKVNLGRYKSLALLGDALSQINPNYVVNIYTTETKSSVLDYLAKHHCTIHQSIAYSLVKEKMISGAFNIVVSGFEPEEIDKSKYSLSTKIADCLASKSPIIAIGGSGDGAIDYLKENQCSYIIDSRSIDLEQLKEYLESDELIQKNIRNATATLEKNHNVNDNRNRFQCECAKFKGEHLYE